MENTQAHVLCEVCDCQICSQQKTREAGERIPEPILLLQKEHDTILEQNQILIGNITRISREAENVQLRKKVKRNLVYLSRLLTEHQAKEETALIPLISKHIDSEAGTSMRVEHAQISSILQNLRKIISSPNENTNKETIRSLIKSAAEFDSLTRAHFSHEENVIFWFAGLYLPRPDPNERPPKT